MLFDSTFKVNVFNVLNCNLKCKYIEVHDSHVSIDMTLNTTVLYFKDNKDSKDISPS